MGSIDQDTTERSRRIATAGPPDKTNNPGTARGQSLVGVRTSIAVEEPIRSHRMHRNELKARLAEYRRRWSEERETVTRFEAFVAAHPDSFERSCTVGHITGSAWIVNRAGDRVLLTHHRKLGRWLQPGGHSDGNPDTLKVALREAREESGLDVRALDETIFDLDMHLIPARGGEPAHCHYDVRFLVQAMEDRFHVSEESFALAWVPAGKVGVFTNHESVLRMARKWQAREVVETNSKMPRRAAPGLAPVHGGARSGRTSRDENPADVAGRSCAPAEDWLSRSSLACSRHLVPVVGGTVA